MDFRGCKNVLY